MVVRALANSWPGSVVSLRLSAEQFHFLQLELMVSLKTGYQMWVLAARISDIGETGGGSVLA